MTTTETESKAISSLMALLSGSKSLAEEITSYALGDALMDMCSANLDRYPEAK